MMLAARRGLATGGVTPRAGREAREKPASSALKRTPHPPAEVPFSLRSSVELEAHLTQHLLPLHARKVKEWLSFNAAADSRQTAAAAYPSVMEHYRTAQRGATYGLWALWTALCGAVGLLFIGTYRTFSWNVMEPVTFLCGSALVWATLLWFKRQRIEFSFPALRTVVAERSFGRLALPRVATVAAAVCEAEQIEAEVRALEEHIMTVQSILAHRRQTKSAAAPKQRN